MDEQNKKNLNEPENKKLKQAQSGNALASELTFDQSAQNDLSKIAKLPLIDTEFDEDLDEESLRMFDKYELNKKFLDILEKEPLVGAVTKIAGYNRTEDIILRTKILRWDKDIKLRNPADKEYLTYKGVGFSCIGQFGELIGHKSQKPYWGIRFDLKNGDFINYAITLSDMRILTDMKVFRLKEIK